MPEDHKIHPVSRYASCLVTFKNKSVDDGYQIQVGQSAVSF